MRRRSWLLILLGASALTVALASREVRAAAGALDAVIEPTEIALGDSARLTVTVTGDSALAIDLPTVPGLEFRVIGHSRRIQMINGITLESNSTVIRVTPDAAGTFKIPGLTANAGPLILKVLPPGSSTLPGVAPPGSTPPLGAVGPNGVRLTPDGSAFIRLSIPKHEVYVGESIPIEIELGLRDGFVASINGIPKLSSNDFTLDNLSHQPERGGRTIESQPFSILTWRSMLAAVKPGKFTVTFETPLTVRIRTRPRGDSLLDDMLGDPFMQNFFGATVTKPISVTSPEASFNVLPLPDQGRPADFGGAVGSFKIAADISSATNTAGDPLTLRLHVTGAGNFDRVMSTMLANGDDWKTYDPKSSFKASDPVGFHGEKTFEQAVIANKSGALTLPPLAFSYFDPETHRYETAHSNALHVSVAPSPAEAAAAGNAPGAAPSAEENQKLGLHPDHALEGPRVASLTPDYFQPALAAVPVAAALLFAGAWAALRRRERIAGDLERARQLAHRELVASLLARMDTAAAAQDAAGYLAAARAALQYALGRAYGLAAAEIDRAAIQVHAADDPERVDIDHLFALADEANYSGARVAARDFARWTELVKHRLEAA